MDKETGIGESKCLKTNALDRVQCSQVYFYEGML